MTYANLATSNSPLLTQVKRGRMPYPQWNALILVLRYVLRNWIRPWVNTPPEAVISCLTSEETNGFFWFICICIITNSTNQSGTIKICRRRIGSIQVVEHVFQNSHQTWPPGSTVSPMYSVNPCALWRIEPFWRRSRPVMNLIIGVVLPRRSWSKYLRPSLCRFPTDRPIEPATILWACWRTGRAQVSWIVNLWY